jgi:hypothetical protein
LINIASLNIISKLFDKKKTILIESVNLPTYWPYVFIGFQFFLYKAEGCLKCLYLSEPMCGGNNGRLFSLLAIKIHPTTNKKKGKGKRLEIVWWREEEEGRWCIQKSFAGDLYVADGSEWKLFFRYI